MNRPFLALTLLRRARSRASMCGVIAVVAAVSACGGPESREEEAAPATNAGTAEAASSTDATPDSPVRLVRIGGGWVDRPSAFLDRPTITKYRNELARAAQGSSTELAFVECEGRGIFPTTRDASACASILDAGHGYELDFVVGVFDERMNRCATLSSGCRPHQAIRVRGWDDGIRRPALFVERLPLQDVAPTLLLVRPKVDAPQVAVSLVRGFRLDREVSARVATDLGFEGESFVNLTHVSNAWTRADRKMRLDAARAEAMAIMTLPLTVGGLASGIAVLQGGASVTTVARALAVLDIVANGVGLIEHAVNRFGLRYVLTTLEPGSPEHRAASAAVFVAAIAPYLGAVSGGAGFVRSASQALLKAKIVAELARAKGISIQAVEGGAVLAALRGVDGAWNGIADLLLRARPADAATLFHATVERAVVLGLASR